jgi:hypothetical protein
MPNAPSADELRAFAEEHLLYEVRMLTALTTRLKEVLEYDQKAGKRDLEWLDMETRNAQVESFAMHARGLLDFFYETAPVHRDDALARHFVDGEWNPPPQTEALADVKRRVNKEVAHLTYPRLLVTEEAKNWDYGRIWLDFGEVIRAFLDRASPDRLPPAVVSKIKEILPPNDPLAWDRERFSVLASATNSEMVMVWEPLDRTGKGLEISSDD